MTPRSIRRAAERKAAKLARKAERVAHSPIPETPEPSRDCEGAILSPAQLAANRSNAQLSTGPTSSQGKAKSCLNAVKTGLTGRTVLLPSDNSAEYQRHIASFEKEFRPVGAAESALVQSLADIAWRLQRIPALEMAIFANGCVEFANHFDDRDVSLRPSLIEMHTFLVYEKQIRNLQLQESRLCRRREKEMAELRQLRQEREAREKDELDIAAKLYLAAKKDGKSFRPADRGFVFSIDDIESYLEGVRAANIARATMIKDRDAALNHRESHSQAA